MLVRKQAEASLILLFVLMLCPSFAEAHAELISSNPTAGAQLTAVPPTITLTFNEPIDDNSNVALIDAQFRRTELSSSAAGDVLQVEMPSGVAAGTYSIEFDAVSADGHTVLGSIQFQIVDERSLLRMPLIWVGGAFILGLWLIFIVRQITLVSAK